MLSETKYEGEKQRATCEAFDALDVLQQTYPAGH
jgi:hypothetical protein